jgi:hypothetical protein
MEDFYIGGASVKLFLPIFKMNFPEIVAIRESQQDSGPKPKGCEASACAVLRRDERATLGQHPQKIPNRSAVAGLGRRPPCRFHPPTNGRNLVEVVSFSERER